MHASVVAIFTYLIRLHFNLLLIVAVEIASDFDYYYFQVSKMGLLSEGNPLSWEETKALADHVRKHGIEQFINLYKKYKDIKFDVLKWGDEVRPLDQVLALTKQVPLMFNLLRSNTLSSVLMMRNKWPKQHCEAMKFYRS